ncbi:hypothetical protein BCR36DRAFT_178189 [Piromyces finnis]|uniref:Uncharacterized protein n=1 Tax=Piromyces finnis TaxID=1754191 RepID=A0A1Y1VHC7_9FUNG|nr:hypothetical protein BCR36DRAFT_178189 [Piromyces finnis]|eukprot:ORX56137.1 hypothetical protein BCR36DRAFT_178189 [Piromyces finnis]
MESFNQLYPTLDTSSLLESTLEDIYKKEEATNNQFISNLKSINEVKKLNERRNANINSRNNTMMNSITIPTLLDIDHNSNSNLLMNNMIQNQLLNPNISSINKISKLNNLNLYNQNSEKYNLQSRPLDITNNCCNLQSSNMLNSLNTYPNLNLKSIYSPVQMNESTTQMNQNACYLSTPPLLSLINNNQLFEKINLLNNDEIKTQIERLYLDKLIKDNQLLSNKEVKNKFENMIIPSVDSNENNLVNNNILIPSIETDLINNMIIPKSEPNESIVTNSNLLNSINIPFNLESNNEDQLSDNLLKQYQLQEQQLAMKINNNLSKKYVNDSKFENILTNIPTITINESNDLFKPSDISTQENNNGSSIDINTLLKPTMNIRQNAINNYTPLSPELSPLLNSDNIIIESNKTLENCVKKNEHIALSSRNTLNSILSITPEMEPINSPIIKNNISNFNSNQNELMGNFYDSFKPSECKINENPSDLLMMGNGLLNTPATPKSAIISPDLNSGDFTDISSINFDSFEVNSLFNNNSTNEKKCNDGEQQILFNNFRHRTNNAKKSRGIKII